MARRVLLTTLITGLALMLATPVVQAQTNSQSITYSGVCSIAVTPPNPTAGTTATVSGTNFPSNQTFSITFDGTTGLGSATTNGAGSFSKDVTIPADASAGPHTISVPCSTTNVESTTTVQVLAAGVTAPLSPAPLARTGTDVEPLVLIGLGAVAAGVAFILASRRRRSQRAA